MSKEKIVKVYFCPKCKSMEVGYTFGFKNLFGVIPRMRCQKCGFNAMIFPQLVVDCTNKRCLARLKRKKRR